MLRKTFAQNWLQIFRDSLFVLRGLWLLLLLNLLALLAFLLMPQGTDIILGMMEPKPLEESIIPITALLTGLFSWCVSSEFCTRILIYMTDNSGHSISPERVESRKHIQTNIAGFFLYYPVFLVAIAFTKAYFQNRRDIDFSWSVLFYILLALLAEVILLGYLYQSNRKHFLGRHFNWMHLSNQEKYWTSKLYGIFNDYRVDLKHSEGAHVLRHEDLPREKELPNGIVIPSAFVLIGQPKQDPKNKSILVWIYHIPLSFYKNLITQLTVLSGIAIVMILVFSFADTGIYQKLGATALISFSFASWQVIYTLFHFLDKAQPLPKINLTYRLIVFAWLCICSYINTDHPVRSFPLAGHAKREFLADHFKSWLREVKKKYTTDSNQTIPVFFIAAEGGALRTGAFTALLLAKLQDSFPAFKNNIYCYSTVSGGTLGANFFNSLHEDPEAGNPAAYSKTTIRFFEIDYLSAVTGKLVFGEPLNYFIPAHIAKFDRAIALENSWERGWEQATNKPHEKNAFSNSFENNNQTNMPALFINTVEAETGLPCVWSNTVLDSNISLAASRDLRTKYQVSLSYATAINLSTRFPIISPAAMFHYKINKKDSTRLHYVDGGYFENKGQETLLQVIEAIGLKKYPGVKPYIIQFNFSEEDNSGSRGIRFANDVTEIIKGIYNTRNGRVLLATQQMKKYVAENFSDKQLINLSLDLSQKKFPMNWVLSHTAMKRVDLFTDSLLHLQKDSAELKKLYAAFKTIKK